MNRSGCQDWLFYLFSHRQCELKLAWTLLLKEVWEFWVLFQHKVHVPVSVYQNQPILACPFKIICIPWTLFHFMTPCSLEDKVKAKLDEMWEICNKKFKAKASRLFIKPAVMLFSLTSIRVGVIESSLIFCHFLVCSMEIMLTYHTPRLY